MLALLVAVLGLTALDIFQDRVIEKQLYELRWLTAHSTIRPDTIVADLKKEGKIPADAKLSSAPPQSNSQAPSASSTPAVKSASAPASAPPAAQVTPSLKP